MLIRSEPAAPSAQAQPLGDDDSPRQPPGDEAARPPNPLRLVRLHRHFHGRWSALRLAVGVVVNLGGLMGLGGIVMGA